MKQTCETCLGSRNQWRCGYCKKQRFGTRSLWAPVMDIASETVADRAVEEIRRAACFAENSVSAELDRIGISRSVFSNWLVGNCTPGGGTLASMAEHGYDVHYILTGVRKWRPNEHEKKA